VYYEEEISGSTFLQERVMSSVAEPTLLQLGPDANGMLLAPQEFDTADFEEGWRYELVRGVLIVTPSPSHKERDPNDELGYLLRRYHSDHPQGSALDATVSEETIQVGDERRRADRAIWAGLGRLPADEEVPTIVIEFVSAGRRSRQRDYEEKRDEYLGAGVREYWIIDRFTRTMPVFSSAQTASQPQSVHEQESYTTTLLPGFELPLARLFELADRWER
jgi:Uma2 family endonuclease